MQSCLRDICIRRDGGETTPEFGEREIKGEILERLSQVLKGIEKEFGLAQITMNAPVSILVLSNDLSPLIRPAAKLNDHRFPLNELCHFHGPCLQYLDLCVGGGSTACISVSDASGRNEPASGKIPHQGTL